MSGENGKNGSPSSPSSASPPSAGARARRASSQGGRPGELGVAGDGDTEEVEEYAIGEVPVPVFELAERCRAFVKSAFGIELDYEPETLPVLDEYLKGAAASIADRPEVEPLITRSAAAYLGEVVRRRVDGFWRLERDAGGEEPPAEEAPSASLRGLLGTWVVSSRRAFLTVNPLASVRNALAPDEGGEAASELELSPPDEALAEARLAAMPPVSEEEYRLLSTRVEVIDVIYEAMREQMRVEDRASLVFDEADYADE